MIYIVYYRDDKNRLHMAFVKSFYEVKFFKDRFGEVTVESYKNKQFYTNIAMAIEVNSAR